MITRPKNKMDNKILNDLKNQAYITACEHGFYEEELSDKHCLMLVITELSEAVEADRKGNYAYRKISSTSRYTSFPTSENRFKKEFNAFIKDTVEDELADTAIRLLDLAGLRGIEIQRIQTMEEAYVSLFKSMPFPECIYDIVLNITKYGSSSIHCINISLASIFALAESRDIDLLWHIEQKMKYNQTRERLHGKLY